MTTLPPTALVTDPHSLSPEEIAARLSRDGIVILAGFFDRDRSARLAKEIADRVADGELCNQKNEQYNRLFEVDVDVYPATDLVECNLAMHDPQLMGITTAICGRGWRSTPPSIFSTNQGGRQGWHQDARDTDPAHLLLNRIIYPRDTQPEQGGLVYVPGSHRMGDIPKGGNHEPLDGQEEVFPTAGTVALMNARCYHRVPVNGSDRRRSQVNMRAYPRRAPANLGGQPVFRTGKWNFFTAKPE